MTNGLLPRATSDSERLVVQTSLLHWSSGIIHRALPSRWPSQSRPSFELFPLLLRGIGATSCRSGGFWVTNGLLPRERKRIRTAGRVNFVGPLVVFLSLGPRISCHHTQSAAVLFTLAAPPFLRNFFPCCCGGSGPLPVVPEDSG